VATGAISKPVCQDARKAAKPNGEAQHCQPTKKDSARMPCYKDGNVGGPMRLSRQQPIEPATWQLARTPNPAGGPDSISVTKIAEATRSDQDVTGLTPGVLVLLPEKASALVEHAWRSIPELAVAIAEDHRLLHGVIPLADITTAMQTLQSNCLR
jgi:hypothetical protein